MATLQRRGESWRCLFLYEKRRYSFTIGKVDEAEANAVCANVDYILMRLKQHLLTLPEECDIVTFVRHDGKPPARLAGKSPIFLTVESLVAKYLESQTTGTLEPSTLQGIEQDLAKWSETFGADFPLRNLTLPDLQRHVDRRTTGSEKVRPATVRKEVVSLRTVWNWARRTGLLDGTFPQQGLHYPQVEPKPPFMSRAEIEGQLDSASLWDCMYLTIDEVRRVLGHVQETSTLPWLHPMVCFAAFTGARRSEILRAEVTDLDFESDRIRIREAKRSRGTISTRSVPFHPVLQETLSRYLEGHPGCAALFCNSKRPANRSPGTVEIARGITKQEASKNLKRVVAGSRWGVIRGWHVFRQSFICNCVANGVDKHHLEHWVGDTHGVADQYAHLIQSEEREEFGRVFGG